jgi:hypothetical protein
LTRCSVLAIRSKVIQAHSLLIRATGRAVGLHFAGANGGSVFNPIDDVLKALGVKLVTKSMKTPKAKTKASKKAPKK